MDNDLHSEDECSTFHVDANWKFHKIRVLQDLFWPAVWENLGRPPKDLSLKRKDNVLVAVTYQRQHQDQEEGGEPDLADLFNEVEIVFKGGMKTLARLFQ
jgi:hypothetical protein